MSTDIDGREYYIANCIERLFWAAKSRLGGPGHREAARRIARIIENGRSPEEMYESLVRQVRFIETMVPITEKEADYPSDPTPDTSEEGR